jgi:exosortase A-associated hydrolase 2
MMSGPGAAPVHPFYLSGPAGPLFAIYHLPNPDADRGDGLVYVPPFAEEMNRCRRMAALQARALAASGVGVLLLDLHGTGDSGGDFRDARWCTWLRDVETGADWLQRQGRSRVGAWGLRLGALLAAELASRGGRFDRLLLWQPVVSGEAMMTQFLRVRIAAALGDAGTRETTKLLREKLRSGDSIEVAGYELHAELWAAIDTARLDRLPPTTTAVDWVELVPEQGRSTAGSERVTKKWREAGVQLSASTVVGQPFWSLQETTVVPELIAATSALFGTPPR